jgi:protein involved in polysaccharide export with SLBB domain
LVIVVSVAAVSPGHAWSQAAPGGAGAGGGAAAGGASGTGTANSGNANAAAEATAAGRNATDSSTQASRDAARRETDQRSEVPAGSQDLRTEFQQMVEATTGRRLPIFGASLFGGVPSTFAPVTDIPVSPNYVLGPGDEINVQLSGQVNQQLRFTVDRSGAIAIPGIGTVHVAGLPFGQLKDFLDAQLGKIYRNFTLSTNLGSLRTIQVFVVGEARRPGAYSISSLSTLTNAVFASGGPLPNGSLRDIQVKRGGVTIDHFDLYDLLLHGDKTKDVALMSGDVIFIPFVGPQVAIVGSIDDPGIYELKGETTVCQSLQFAGGQTAVAAGSTVRLERIFEHSMRSLEDVNGDRCSVELLQNGDILSVTSVIDRFRDAVTLRGNVANPGRYVWHPGMHVSDLIPNKESLITRNYWRKRNELGQLVQDYLPDTAAPGEGSLLVHGNSTDATSFNTDHAGSATGNGGGNSVGAALTGGNSPFSAKTDVILSAPDIDWNFAVIERQSPVDLTTSLIPFNLGALILNGDATQNLALLAGDVVTIFSKADLRVPSNQQTRYVRLEGEFNSAGVYSVLPGETLRGLLARAGGFTPDAYLYASEFTRESTRRVEEQRLHEYADELEAQISAVTASNQARAITSSDQIAAVASESDARSAVARLRAVTPIGRIVLDLQPDSRGIAAVPDLPLEDGDRFVVPRIPANVTVQGQVYNANAFVFASNERVIDYLRRAGGPDRDADKKRIFLLRADGSVISSQYNKVQEARIYPGDTIVVPPIIDKRALLQRISAIASIIGNFGIGLGTLAILARQ